MPPVRLGATTAADSDVPSLAPQWLRGGVPASPSGLLSAAAVGAGACALLMVGWAPKDWDGLLSVASLGRVLSMMTTVARSANPLLTKQIARAGDNSGPAASRRPIAPWDVGPNPSTRMGGAGGGDRGGVGAGGGGPRARAGGYGGGVGVGSSSGSAGGPSKADERPTWKRETAAAHTPNSHVGRDRDRDNNSNANTGRGWGGGGGGGGGGAAGGPGVVGVSVSARREAFERFTALGPLDRDSGSGSGGGGGGGGGGVSLRPGGGLGGLHHGHSHSTSSHSDGDSSHHRRQLGGGGGGVGSGSFDDRMSGRDVRPLIGGGSGGPGGGGGARAAVNAKVRGVAVCVAWAAFLHSALLCFVHSAPHLFPF